MNKLWALWNLFRKGEQVADVEAWKKQQINVNSLTMLLLAAAGVARAFGFDMGLSDETAAALATGLLALVNWVLTIVTSRHAGIRPANPAGPAVPIERERSPERRASDMDAMAAAATAAAATGSAHDSPQPYVRSESLVPSEGRSAVRP